MPVRGNVRHAAGLGQAASRFMATKPQGSERSIVTEAAALALLGGAILTALCLATYDPSDPALNVASTRTEVGNLVGQVGAWISDILLQVVGLLAFAVPIGMAAFGIRGFAAQRMGIPFKLAAGFACMLLALAGGLSLLPAPSVSWLANASATGGLVGLVVARGLTAMLNTVGAGIVLAVVFVLTVMLTLQVSLSATAERAFRRHGDDAGEEPVDRESRFSLTGLRDRFAAWWEAKKADRAERASERAAERAAMLEEEDEETIRVREREVRRRTEELVKQGLMDDSTDRPPVRARTTPRTTPLDTADDHAPSRVIPRTDRLSPPSGAVAAQLVAPTVETATSEPAPQLSAAAAARAKFAEAQSRRTARAAADAIASGTAPASNNGSAAPAAAPEPLVSVDPAVAEMVSTLSIVRTAPNKPAQPKLPLRATATDTGYLIPSTDLLTAPPAVQEEDERQLESRAVALAEKCKEFSVTGHIHRINPGPVVTTFEFKPDPGIKYSRVVGLADDLCLALKAESIRIDRIPGKSTVGIEVPNVDRRTIFLREIVESATFQNSPSKLTLALGHTIDGQDFIADLQKMPHLLIAGSTGSGKSVMINAIVTSILYKASPEDVKFIMVDPKRLELGLYEGIPHLLTPIVVDPKRAANALKWAVTEMENRYRTLAGYGVRNIEQFNKEVRAIVNQRMASESEELPKPLPYIVVLIDELADLMMVASSEVESSITRLAQMARAVGIHLVLATQRPSVDVITGLIKANFPSRMSFRVSSKVDSRTIIDTNGAEQLLGQGDMLFLPPGTSRLVRVHGSFLSERDVNAVTSYIKRQGQPEYDETVTMSLQESGGIDGGGARDELFEDALKIVCDMGRASTSVLQRRLRVGYGRAAAILDQMEQAGFVGPPDGSRPRPVLAAAFEFYERNNQIREERDDE